jgi:hypothetical protein
MKIYSIEQILTDKKVPTHLDFYKNSRTNLERYVRRDFIDTYHTKPNREKLNGKTWDMYPEWAIATVLKSSLVYYMLLQRGRNRFNIH